MIEERARECIRQNEVGNRMTSEVCIEIITALLEEVERLNSQTHIDPLYHHEAIKQATRASYERCANLAETIETDHWSKVGDPRLKQPHCAIAAAIRKELEGL